MPRNSRVNLAVHASYRSRTATSGAPLRPAGYAGRWHTTMTTEDPKASDSSEAQSRVTDRTAPSAVLIDRQLIRRAVPVVAAAILGGLLTGVPTVWVSVSQQRVQIDLAKCAEQEQMRQRRVQAGKNFLTACANMALRTASARNSRSARPAWGGRRRRASSGSA